LAEFRKILSARDFSFSYRHLIYLGDLTRYHLEKLVVTVNPITWSQSALRDFSSVYIEVQGWLNLVDVEYNLNITHLTLRGIGPTAQSLLENRTNNEVLPKLVNKLYEYGALREVPTIIRPNDFQILAFLELLPLLVQMQPADVENFMVGNFKGASTYLKNFGQTHP
jgi:hypothetical protein